MPFSQESLSNLCASFRSSALTFTIIMFSTCALASTFDAPIDRELTATSPTGSTSADFNEDGFPDMAFAMSGQLGGDGGLSVVLSDGAGSYDDDTPFEESFFAPRAVATEDFNGDGHLDLAAVGVGPGSVGKLQVFLGDGFGQFATPPQFEVAMPGFPTAVAAGYVDADSVADLLVADSSGLSGVRLLLGVGDGAFSAPQAIVATNNTSPFDLAIGDFDNDSALDFATSEGIYHGQGDGSFAKILGTGGSIAVATGDLNNDGFEDVVSFGFNASSLDLRAILNDRKGGYIFSSLTDLPTGPRDLDLADMNGDGFADAVLTDRIANTIRIFPGFGDGSFDALESVGAGAQPHPLVVSDLNRDGLPDLAAGYGGAEPFALVFYQNLPTAGSPSLEIAATSYSVYEGASTATITVQRSGDPMTAVGVDYATTNGTADEGQDYYLAAGRLAFPIGVLAVTFDVVVIDDTLREGVPETVTVSLFATTGAATLGPNSTATLFIRDNGNDSDDGIFQVPALKTSGLMSLAVVLGSVVAWNLRRR
jgi:hypothetical protein